MEELFDLRSERPGYRLHRLEIFNWGTFDSSDGQVYRFEPEGRTSLLVGHNGSGKSTLVDAILTLLVPANIRNYNVAAGAKKTERSEKSYIRGAFGRGADESHAAVARYLRPRGGQFSAVSAVFRDEELDAAFTLLQVLHLTADGSVDKVFGLIDEVRDLKTDLGGITSSDAIRGHLKLLGYQTTRKFIEYHGWLAARTKMRSKAMGTFNQTVAVKDIDSLNNFIRHHMLEAHDWREKVSRLLQHFNDLSAAHQELVRSRKAEELLVPVEKHGAKYRRHSEELEAAEQRLAAADTFFRVQTVELFEPEIAAREEELRTTIEAKRRLSGELKEIGQRIRKITNEIEQAGGQRLRDLPTLIELEETRLTARRDQSRRYHELLARCEISQTVSSAAAFDTMRQRLQSMAGSAAGRLAELSAEHEESLGELAGVRHCLREEQNELEILGRRSTNLPVHLSALRSRMCEDLQLTESALPFAAELISVDPDERRWEASAEMVLRSFALSLLVPHRYYERVRSYVESTQMSDAHGRGQRLVYLRVGKGAPSDTRGDRLQPQSLVHKLTFRPKHDLAPWVRGEVERRFDFQCCDRIEEFNAAPRLAMTENRHIKTTRDRHEKDDRPRAVDPRHYVLGWDNTEKKRRIRKQIHQLESDLTGLEQKARQRAETLDALRRQQSAATAAWEVRDFDALNVRRHEAELAALRQEQADLESSNEVVRTLKQRLADAEREEAALAARHEAAIKREAVLSTELESGRKLVAVARRAIQDAMSQGVYEWHARQFAAIGESLGEPPLTSVELFDREKRWNIETNRRIEALRKRVQPLGEKLVEAMSRFLREFKEEQADLSASVHSLESFLGLLEQVRREDLPRHERKFKDRLNDKVSQEVALFNGALRQECKHIESKIAQLNEALAQLEYHPGTFMRLEPREVIDREIADFRRSLRECLDDSLENSDEANEARFVRIAQLVERLAARENTTWRDKVIDVRRWYNFAAREIDAESGETRYFYEDSAGQSGGEKAKLAFTILVASIAYQFDIDPHGKTHGRFQFVVVDEMFSKVDDQNAEYALKLFEQFGLQILIVSPLDAKARVTEPHVDCYLHVVKDESTHRSQLYTMTAREYDEVVKSFTGNGKAHGKRAVPAK